LLTADFGTVKCKTNHKLDRSRSGSPWKLCVIGKTFCIMFRDRIRTFDTKVDDILLLYDGWHLIVFVKKKKKKLTLDCDAVLTDERYDDFQCSQISFMYLFVSLLMKIKCHSLFWMVFGFRRYQLQKFAECLCMWALLPIEYVDQ
jgi:hypothetical protein